ncbi:hypothetical protein FF36_03912 [Frankia torreyi]|uniref:Uncharacterized protein n=1 Tax=Frankia torreyi TaxID=1856 RepID=A0A0D8BBR7_9ACTN|nr:MULTISPECIES: hypothetical protein [Frankia]KJE21708.1 hypothetical protein FF36_03912 [Frankia torreyi]KQM01924.1 hypothetical protein FF86_10922 [Frankia sp. CpI1-P]
MTTRVVVCHTEGVGSHAVRLLSAESQDVTGTQLTVDGGAAGQQPALTATVSS